MKSVKDCKGATVLNYRPPQKSMVVHLPEPAMINELSCSWLYQIIDPARRQIIDYAWWPEPPELLGNVGLASINN